MKKPLVDIRNLSVQFGEGLGRVVAVRGMNLQIHEGETVALVGESGSGKSVTAMALTRLNPEPGARYLSGDILFRGRSVLSCSASERRSIRGQHISYVFQEPATSLNPVLTIGAQIKEAVRLHQKDVSARDEAIRLLDIVGIPNAARRLKAYPHELSGGMQQRVMIAIALACRPALLVADEPTTALDVTIQKQILRLLRKLQQRFEMSILFITHNLALVAELADRVAVMKKGEIVESGSVVEVLKTPRHEYTQALIAAVPTLHSDFFDLPRPDVIPPGTGPSAREQSAASSGHPLLILDSISVSFGRGRHRIEALKNVDLCILEGQTLGIVGESGSGKTTLGRCIMGMQHPNAGRILYKGEPLTSFTDEQQKAYRRTVQMIFQDPFGSLNPRIPIGRMLVEVMHVHNIGIPSERWKNAAQRLEQVGLPSSALDRYPHEFSGGQRQRIVIARALTLQPEVLVADEPVSALDVSIQAEILGILKRLQTQLGLTLLFISHDLAVVRHVCDQVVVMNQGEVVESGLPISVYAEPRQAYTKKLLEAIPDIQSSLDRRRLV